jgi:DNA-binding MarR family transcriptional regulator
MWDALLVPDQSRRNIQFASRFVNGARVRWLMPSGRRETSPTTHGRRVESHGLQVTRADLEKLDQPDVEPLLTVFWLVRLMRRFSTWRQDVFREIGMDPTEGEILVGLRVIDSPDVSLGWIRETMRLTSGGVTRAVDRLVAGGMLDKFQDGTDRRGVRLQLTPSGHNAAENVLGFVSARQSALLSNVDRQDVERLLGTLDEILELYAGVPVPP